MIAPTPPRPASWRLVSGIDCSEVGGSKPEPRREDELLLYGHAVNGA